MRQFDKLSLSAWVLVLLASVAIGTGLVAWETAEAGNLCLSRLLFDIRCPGCGMGHALILAWQGLWTESIHHHPLGIPVLIVWTAWVANGLRNRLRGKTFAEGFGPSRWLARPVPAALTVGMIVGVYVLRLSGSLG